MIFLRLLPGSFAAFSRTLLAPFPLFPLFSLFLFIPFSLFPFSLSRERAYEHAHPSHTFLVCYLYVGLRFRGTIQTGSGLCPTPFRKLSILRNQRATNRMG